MAQQKLVRVTCFTYFSHSENFLENTQIHIVQMFHLILDQFINR